MSKNNRIINILLAAILFVTFNFLFILNGCSTSNSTDTMVEQSQSVSSGEEDASAAHTGEATVSEDSVEETSVSENENDEDANNTSSEEDPNSLKNIYQRFIESGKPSILVFSYDADCCATTIVSRN